MTCLKDYSAFTNSDRIAYKAKLLKISRGKLY